MLRDIEGYEDIYEIDNSGNVYRKAHIQYRELIQGKTKCSFKRKRLKPVLNAGYFAVNLYKNNLPKVKKIHRLVATMFCEGRKPSLVVNHIDGNKLNNNSYNLEWCTVRENEDHATMSGLKASFERNGKGKLTEENVCEIQRLRKDGVKTKELSRMFNVTERTIFTRLNTVITGGHN